MSQFHLTIVSAPTEPTSEVAPVGYVWLSELSPMLCLVEPWVFTLVFTTCIFLYVGDELKWLQQINLIFSYTCSGIFVRDIEVELWFLIWNVDNQSVSAFHAYMHSCGLQDGMVWDNSPRLSRQNPCVYVCRRGTADPQPLRISRSLHS